MKPYEVEFIIQTIGSDKKEFCYFRDKYVLELLKYHVNTNKGIEDLRKSNFAKFLEKVPVKQVLSNCGNGILSKDDLDEYIPDGVFEFNYTISKWGEYINHRKDPYFQTTRPGLSVVLQLNFDQWHNFQYHKWIKSHDADDDPFVVYCHPTLYSGEFTMAWCRLDFSLETGEVLIEEIQNDWIREVKGLMKDLDRLNSSEARQRHWFFAYYPVSDFMRYAEILMDYYLIWDEAILSLALYFIKEEIGLDTIYYHDFESGNLLKGLGHSFPPRSLYTKLPKRFNFSLTDEAPKSLMQEKYLQKLLRSHDLRWWVLNI